MNLIGIMGHRGSGRKTYAWMIANTLEFIIKKKNREDFPSQYVAMCELVKDDENIATHSTAHVTLDTFSGSIYDLIKIINANLCEFDLSDRKVRESYTVCLGTMEVAGISARKPNATVADMLEKINSKNIDFDNCWMLLDEYVMYIACSMFKKYFGKSFWIQHLSTYDTLNSDPMFNNEYRIFIDVKTAEESKYIRDNHGVVVGINNPNRKKPGGYQKIDKVEPDFLFEPDEKLENNMDSIFELSEKLYKHFKSCQEEEQ